MPPTPEFSSVSDGQQLVRGLFSMVVEAKQQLLQTQHSVASLELKLGDRDRDRDLMVQQMMQLQRANTNVVEKNKDFEEEKKVGFLIALPRATTS